MGNDASVDADGVSRRLAIVLRGRKPYSWGQTHGLSRGAIGRMLQGTLPTPDRLLPALRAENLSLTWLLTGQGTPFLVHTPMSDPEGADLVRRLRQDMGKPRFTIATAPGDRVAVVLTEPVTKTDADGSSYSYTHVEVIGGPALGHLTLDQVDHSAVERRVGMSIPDWERLAGGWMSATELQAYKPKLQVVTDHMVREPPTATYAPTAQDPLSESERRLINAWRAAPDQARNMVLTMLEAVS